MSPLAHDILGYVMATIAIGFFLSLLLILVAFNWLDDKVQRIKRLFKKKKPPARARNRTVIRRTAKRTTPTRTVRRRTA